MLPVTAVTSASFLGEVLPALSTGGAVVMPTQEELLDFVKLTGLIARRRVSILSTVPTVLAGLAAMRDELPRLRLILSGGHQGPDAAGHVIEAFGTFVMGGNFVIGIIAFAILVIVNFVVITKGSGRIAEVAARFSLDALPGKQMAIDADLSAGLIDEAEARARREEITREADFYGAMDGASKFVRGDAIAGIIITLVNIAGGFAIGAIEKGWSLRESLAVFTRLTIGDGLVSQVPSFIIAIAAGLIVARTGGRQTIGDEMPRQLPAGARHSRDVATVAMHHHSHPERGRVDRNQQQHDDTGNHAESLQQGGRQRAVRFQHHR